jgi:peroxiredoxin
VYNILGLTFHSAASIIGAINPIFCRLGAPMPTAASSIAEQVQAHLAVVSTQLPPEILGVFGGEAAALAAAGVPVDVAGSGAPMPDAALLDVHGEPTTLNAARNGKPAVVVFYRGAWCPFCNIALRTYEVALAPTLKERGIALIAISPQKTDGSLSVQQKNDLTFFVLTDSGNQIASKLGILTAPNEDVRGAQAALGLDLAQVNADGTYNLPMPTVVLVDAAGTIRWTDVHPNYTERTEVPAILEAIATKL